MELYLIRHGETNENKNGVYLGVSNPVLSDDGINQSLDLRRKLNNTNINKVYVSPLERCIQTSNIIFVNKESEIVDNFKEINFGNWELKSYKEISEEYKEDFQRFINDYECFEFPNGESFRQFYSRVVDSFEEIKSRKEESIAIVAHEGTLRSIICHILGLGMKGFYKFKFYHGYYSKVQVYENDCQIEYLNR